jgi:hypothetical protein
VETILRTHDPFEILGFEFEFRNDIIRNEEKSPKIRKDMIEHQIIPARN